MMIQLPTQLKGLVDYTVDREIQDYLTVRSSVLCELGKLSDNLRRQVVLNLTRGWCSSLSGTAYKLHRLLAGRFEFPVFALGRGSEMAVSCRRTTEEDFDEFVESFQALWNLGKNPNDRHWRNHHFNMSNSDGPAKGWIMVRMNRPANLSVQGILAARGWKSIFDVVPKDAVLAALSAVQRKETIEFKVNS